MDQQARPCPLCGLTLAEGVPMEILEEHFQRCSKTDDRDAPRREWDRPHERPTGA
jgi:hypothetical protein